VTPDELVAIRERDQGFISSHSRLVVDDHRQTATDRRALLAEVDRLAIELELVKRYGKTSDELADEAERGYDLSRLAGYRQPDDGTVQ
jgi:hypothetical protein